MLWMAYRPILWQNMVESTYNLSRQNDAYISRNSIYYFRQNYVFNLLVFFYKFLLVFMFLWRMIINMYNIRIYIIQFQTR